MKNIIFFIAILIVFVSCAPPVVFDKPYPSGVENLEVIPSVFHGSYVCESDSSLILIDDQSVIHQTNHFFWVSKEKVKEIEGCSVIDDKMIMPNNKICVPIRYIEDSLMVGEFTTTDTLFNISESAVARMYKGNLVLSQRMKSNDWMVQYLSPDGIDLQYRSIIDRSQLSEIQEITNVEDITTIKDDYPRYRVRPTEMEFDKMFENEEIFIVCEYLYRVNLGVEDF